MVSTVTTHVIGTVSLLVIFGVVAVSFTFNYFTMQMCILSYSLQEIAQYVSSEISDLVSLCLMSSEDQSLVKVLEIPPDIRSEPYSVQIVAIEDIVQVVAQSTLHPTVFGVSIFPWSSNGNIKPYLGNDPPPEIAHVKPSRLLQSSSQATPVAWCIRVGNMIMFGLGMMED